MQGEQLNPKVLEIWQSFDKQCPIEHPFAQLLAAARATDYEKMKEVVDKIFINMSWLDPKVFSAKILTLLERLKGSPLQMFGTLGNRHVVVEGLEVNPE